MLILLLYNLKLKLIESKTILIMIKLYFLNGWKNITNKILFYDEKFAYVQTIIFL